MNNFLYRGVSKIDDERNGRLIKPKGEKVAIVGQAGERWMQAGEGVECGQSINNAVIAHQYDSDVSNTAYISTTKNKKVAKKFATSDGIEDGYIYTLDRDKFEQYGVTSIERDIGCVNDEEEVSITTLNLGPIPSGVIVSKILIENA